jgi:hypothetical protein
MSQAKFEEGYTGGKGASSIQGSKLESMQIPSKQELVTESSYEVSLEIKAILEVLGILNGTFRDANARLECLTRGVSALTNKPMVQHDAAGAAGCEAWACTRLQQEHGLQSRVQHNSLLSNVASSRLVKHAI